MHSPSHLSAFMGTSPTTTSPLHAGPRVIRGRHCMEVAEFEEACPVGTPRTPAGPWGQVHHSLYPRPELSPLCAYRTCIRPSVPYTAPQRHTGLRMGGCGCLSPKPSVPAGDLDRCPWGSLQGSGQAGPTPSSHPPSQRRTELGSNEKLNKAAVLTTNANGRVVTKRFFTCF